MIKGDWIKPGATVIDVGINRVPDEKAKHVWSAMSTLKQPLNMPARSPRCRVASAR